MYVGKDPRDTGMRIPNAGVVFYNKKKMFIVYSDKLIVHSNVDNSKRVEE